MVNNRHPDSYSPITNPGYRTSYACLKQIQFLQSPNLPGPRLNTSYLHPIYRRCNLAAV